MFNKVKTCTHVSMVTLPTMVTVVKQWAKLWVKLSHDKDGTNMVSKPPFTFPFWLVQVLHPPQKFERSSFWNDWNYIIKNYDVKATFNGFTSLLNLMKIYQLVQNLLMGDTDRHHDIISLIFAYKKSRQKCGSLTFGYKTPNRNAMVQSCTADRCSANLKIISTIFLILSLTF
jgi:hypothetical protein